MNISADKNKNIRAKDPIDILIFEKGLRIKNVIIDKDLDLIGVILNNSKILEVKLSVYPKLSKAEESELQSWELIGNGIGVRWEGIDEDLSVKGFIQTAAINEMIEQLQSRPNQEKASA